ncbi:MAG: cell division protein FtsA [Candidatus Saccharibacteria bacterium]|nr:cell division protein FtsA [Candidatus Saccharibacteria bacterium]
MRDHPPESFVGLDIGTSAVRCVIGMVAPETGKLSIIGHGSSPNVGMRKGVIVHVEDVAEAVSKAVGEAERVSGMQIGQVTVNINGSHVQGQNSRGVIAISASNREITDEDRLRVEEAATIVKLPSNREIIQVFAKNYRLDGQDNIKDPVGMQGVRLEVDTHIVTASTPNIRNLDLLLERTRLSASHHTVSSLAAAEAVLSRQQKESGTVLVDIGAGTTNVVVLEDGEVQHVAVIPMGGNNITNDLAIGLKTDLDIAEAVKLEHADLSGVLKRSRVGVVVNKQRHDFDAEEIKMIVEARVEELIEFIDKELRAIGRSRKLPGGAVLVGGTAKMPGIAQFTREKLELAARVGKLESLGGLQDTVEDPSFYTATGLMVLDMLLAPTHAPKSGSGAPIDGVFGMVEGLFKRLRK